MKFRETPLAGAYLIDIEEVPDERGAFARMRCREAFLAHGLNPHVEQSSISLNRRRGTLRGLHFQADAHAEDRLVRVTRGHIYDVIVDLRPDSPTHHDWYAAELDARSRTQLYLPKGFAHGFQTLEDDTEILYEMSVAYEPTAVRGYHYASPAFGIRWPMPPTAISERDLKLESVE
jgi:dTDP-4-dehydrorhamnose 3,5-epimerase